MEKRSMPPDSLEQTRSLIDSVVDIAGRKFRSRGYRKTTIEDIAGPLGMTKKELCAYFATREDILKEVAWRDTVNALEVVISAMPEDEGADTVLLALCRLVFSDRIKKGKKGTVLGDCIPAKMMLLMHTAILSGIWR